MQFRPVELTPGELPVLLAYATAAITACVPETGQMPTVAWMVVGLLAVELLTRSTSALPVQVTAIGIVLWSGLYGATGRTSAVIGAWFAWWPLLLVVAADRVGGPLTARTRWAIGAIGGAAALAVARTGGIATATGPAVVVVAVAVVVSVTATWVVLRLSGRTAVRR
jgi:hypothetical protein